MSCPKCKAEYRPEFTRNADCSVDLLEQLPEEPVEEVGSTTGSSRLVQILQTNDRSDIQSIRIVLV